MAKTLTKSRISILREKQLRIFQELNDAILDTELTKYLIFECFLDESTSTEQIYEYFEHIIT